MDEYSLKETSKMTGLSADLIRKYEKEFGLEFERTEGGHRRFKKDDVELLNVIRKKIQEQNMSYKQVKIWMSGYVDPLKQDAEEKTNLEEKLDQALVMLGQQREFNQVLVQRLDDMSKNQAEMQEYIDEKLEKRDQVLIETSREIAASREKKPWFKFWKQ